MATIGGPNTEKDNLVFGYDTGYGVNNTATNSRYYQGKPTSNLSNDMTKYFNNWSGMTGSTSYYTTDRGNQGIHLITTNSGGVQFYASSTIYNISANTLYTVSATIKYSGTTPHVNMFYIRQYHNGSQITEGGKFSTSFMIDLGGGWYRAYRTFTTTSTTSYINLQGYQYSNGVNLKIQDLQFEIGNQLSPYAGSLGTRTSTESLIDLKRTTDIDLSNVSFDSTGQPEFDGTDDYIELGDSLNSIGSNATFEIVFKATETSDNYRIMLGWGNGNSNYSGIHIGSWTSGYTDESFHVTLNSSILTMLVRKGHSFYKDNTFHHAIVTVGTNNYSIWIDGVEQTFTFAQGSQSTILNNAIGYNSNITSQIGRRPYGGGTGYFKGDLPVMKVYDKILSNEEIKQNYNAYKNRFNI